MGNEVIAEAQLHHDRFPARKVIIDNLTGLYNYHGMQENFVRILRLCAIAKQPLCLILLKVDEVKNASGKAGEFGDDWPLHGIAQTILTLLRPDDHAARLNGKKFAMLLPDLQFSDAYAMAERLRTTVCEIPIRLPDGSSLPPVTISAGVCKANADDIWSTLITRANQALERAIDAGRNRISD